MTDFITLPPDGVGKKIRHRVLADISIASQTNTPAIYTTLVGTISSATGILQSISTTTDNKLNYYISDIVGTFIAGEVLRNVANTINYATIQYIVPSIYTSQVNIADAQNPDNTQKVDKRGAALATFPEGTPQFDAFGHMQVSQMLSVGEYYHFVKDLPGKYTTLTNGTGTIAHAPATSSMIYTTSSSNDYVKRTTNQYHPYKPGVSNLIYTSCAVLSGATANGLMREWGYFDDFNGFGFRLRDGILYAFFRSDANLGQTITTGKYYTIDTVGSTDFRTYGASSNAPGISFTATSSGAISAPSAVREVRDVEIAQANWNTNTLNNSITSDFLLDITYTNTYWMDIQGTGGRIRVGVLTPDGRRITCHSYNWSSNASGSNVQGPNMRNLNLPMRWAQVQTGSTGGSFRVGVGVVFTESADVQYSGVLTHICPDDPVTVNTDGTTYTPFLSFKAKSIVNGCQNSIIGIHETFDWVSTGSSSLHVGIFVLPSEDYLTGYQWSETINTDTMLYVDQSATAIPQYQTWDRQCNITSAYITGTTLTVTAATGSVFKELYLVGPAVAARTKILKQLTSSAAAIATLAYSSGGLSGAKTITLASGTGVVVGQLISGTGIPVGTFVESINGSTVMISNFLTANASGNYTFFTLGGAGTYTVSISQTAGSVGTPLTAGIAGYYVFKPIESFIAPANSAGRTALGDRIAKSFGLGPYQTAENAKGVFVFAVRALTPSAPSSLYYTKYWKEIR
jgi:hypothetical protein